MPVRHIRWYWWIRTARYHNLQSRRWAARQKGRDTVPVRPPCHPAVLIQPVNQQYQPKTMGGTGLGSLTEELQEPLLPIGFG
ncbi:hypothetical protein GCM10010402_12680 [Actinomadura luteofluorescens]